ncbi:hypothetical protein Pla52n_46270 [Stieleria varia]|uniref:Uncharacterized protein n=1 Tax=Stieleria varia TaxID=2528005 RepID=A0A5C6AMG7_9BACT|nr:hypothetical protein Pla52n_46270 [Stieleria varia]
MANEIDIIWYEYYLGIKRGIKYFYDAPQLDNESGQRAAFQWSQDL